MEARNRAWESGSGARGALRAPGAALLLASLLASGCTSWGPFYEREEGLPGGVTETRFALGLGLDRDERDGTHTFAIRPFYLRQDKPNGARFIHVLPPIYRDVKTEKEQLRRIFPLVWHSSYGTEDERERGLSDDDTVIFPLAFWGNEPGEGSYTLVLPFGGNLKGKLLSDEIRIYGFPLYIENERDDWSSQHFLWPLIAYGKNDTEFHSRFIPFYSWTTAPGLKRRSVLWPIVHWNTETRGTREFDGWLVWPAVGHRSSTDGTASAWTFLWPFFHFAHDEVTGDDHTAIFWPFYKRDRRPGLSESTWYWPFWGEFISERERSSFYLWPLGWNQEEFSASGRHRERHFFVPFWMHSETLEPGADSPTIALRAWPLYSSITEPDGYHEWQFPSIIPVFGWTAGERAYSDILTLFRWREDAESLAWDGPLGLVRYRRAANGEKRLRLLWFLDISLGGGE